MYRICFAHPKSKFKLLQIVVVVFMDPICGIYIAKEFMSLCTTWNVAIRKLYGLPVQSHCRYLMHISQQNHLRSCT